MRKCEINVHWRSRISSQTPFSPRQGTVPASAAEGSLSLTCRVKTTHSRMSCNSGPWPAQRSCLSGQPWESEQTAPQQCRPVNGARLRQRAVKVRQNAHRGARQIATGARNSENPLAVRRFNGTSLHPQIPKSWGLGRTWASAEGN